MTLTLDAPAPPTRAAYGASAIPFDRLLRVEWGKATDTRAARWLLAVVGAATVAIMLAPILARRSVDQDVVSYLQFPALVLGVLLPVVSILTLTSEWTQRTVLTTFTQEPRRARVVGAKVGVSAIIAGLAVLLGGAVTALALGIAASTGRHLDTSLHPAQLIGFVLFVLLNVMMGVAFGALLHNTAASIVLFFALPTAFGILGGVVKSVGPWLDPSRGLNWVLEGHWSGHTGQIVVAMLIWVVAPLVAGVARTVRREIK